MNILQDWLVGSPCSPRDSQESSPTPQFKSLLQHHSSKASILQHSAFFTVQLSQPYRTTGKTTDLTRWTFVGKVMSLLLNMLSRLVITFLPRSKRLLISWLQSPSAVILEPKMKGCWIMTPRFLAPRGEEFNPGPETRLDHSELLCNKVLLKYKVESLFKHHHTSIRASSGPLRANVTKAKKKKTPCSPSLSIP